MVRSKLLVAVAALCMIGGTARSQVVRTGQGVLRGTTEDGAEAFRNIPFAAPPVGALRWKPPQPVTGWSGVRDATAYGKACIQAPVPANMGAQSPIGIALGDQGPMPLSEDCLNLNVRRPAGTKAGAKLPVMVWIFGGGFVFGSGSQRSYAGAGLVRNGVILVTPNYRLGSFGFLAHPDLSAESPNHVSGNYAMLDAIAAMKWVKQNIASFGGDPDNVTIFGESAGAVAVTTLSGSPLAAGLFKRTIAESGILFGLPGNGADQGISGPNREPLLASAENDGQRWLQQAGVASIAAARKLSAEQVLAVDRSGPGRRSFTYRPNVDGWFMPRLSYDLLTRGAYSHPVIVGSNNDEGVLFLGQPSLTIAQYHSMVRQGWGPFADQMLAAYPAATDTEALHAARDMLRDSKFEWTAHTWAREQHGAPVYIYNFDHRPPFPKNAGFDDVQAPHAVEIPYVFGEMFSPQMNWGEDDTTISGLMTRYWTNFAKMGDPNGPGLPRWTPATEASPRSMHFGTAAAAMGEITALQKIEMLDQYYANARLGSTGK